MEFFLDNCFLFQLTVAATTPFVTSYFENGSFCPKNMCFFLGLKTLFVTDTAKLRRRLHRTSGPTTSPSGPFVGAKWTWARTWKPTVTGPPNTWFARSLVTRAASESAASAKITTKEYCNFVGGTFHEEAALCSQVGLFFTVLHSHPKQQYNFKKHTILPPRHKNNLLIQSKPCKMFAATLQPSWPSRPQTKGTLLFYFLKLYNFVFYEIFVGSTSSEVQQPMDLKNHDWTKKNREKIDFQAQFRSTSNQ